MFSNKTRSQNTTRSGGGVARFFRNLLSYTMFLICLLGVLWLCLCYTASVTSPLQHPYIPFFSLTTPFAIGFNIFFIIFWLFARRKWRAIFPLSVLVIFYKLVFSVFGIHYFGSNHIGKTVTSVKVMTWNVHGLGIYNKPVDKEAPGKIFNIIYEETPDILCLPEFYTEDQDAMKPYADKFLRRAGYREYRFVSDAALYSKIFLGTAFFSKYPLRNFKEIELSQYIKMMQCDAQLPNGQMMRTYFIHLQSFLLKDKDKKLIEEIKSRNKELEMKDSRSFARKLAEGYRKRALQADTAALLISQSPYPVLICGDLNDLPGSYSYTTIKGKLKDAFAEKGRGIGRTYNEILPTLRIDHIFYDPSLLRIIGFKTFRTTLSDHNPVIANFEIKSAL